MAHFCSHSLFGQNGNAKPNFVLIVADDLGYDDLGFQACKQIPSPYIDQLAKEGIIFSQAYVSSPVCSPSRAGIITGKHQVGFDFDPDYIELPLTETTLSDRLKSLGYVNGMVGK